MRISTFFLVMFIFVMPAACGDDDVAASDADAGGEDLFRPESDAGRPPGSNSGSNSDPNGDPNVEPNNNTSDAGTNNGNEECTDFGECVLGTSRCVGEEIQGCVDDGDGDNCGTNDLPMACPSPQQFCSDGECVTNTDCIDNDGDGYGPNCAAGPDCDDSNPDRFPGNPEVCDGIDNDCNAGADDVDGLGGTCTTGSGACMATGTPSCEGTELVCNVTNPPGSTEVCDGVDNDCDGSVDEGGVCSMPMCTPDAFEPNDTAMTSATLTMNTRNDATICGSDEDWFDFPTANNTNHRVTITFPDSESDLDLEIYEDGVLFESSLGISDVESVQFRAAPNRSYSARVFNAGSNDNDYFLQVIDIVSCQEEDGFAPNQSIAEAPLLPADWSVYGYACPGQSDFYAMGEVTTGTTVWVDLYDVDFGEDIDLHLWADPDGDGQFDRVDSSTGLSSNESIVYTATHTGDFYYEVVDFQGNGGLYDMDWTK